MAAHSNSIDHERYISAVRDLAIRYGLAHGTITEEDAARLRAVRIVYGVGDGHARGTTYYGSWTRGTDGKVDTVEVCASAEESWVQVACTTVHEFAHVLTTAGHGHDRAWSDACMALGFSKRPHAAGQRYSLAMLAYTLRAACADLAQRMADGTPGFRATSAGLSWLSLLGGSAGPCKAGIGVRGGRSRGIGSGSRLRLWVCQCDRPVRVRVASDAFEATCKRCGSDFVRA